jgi:hypothetical protein
MGEAQPAVSKTIEEASPEQSVAVVLSDGCRPLRRELPALAWMILEQVALDAVLDEGCLLARTSARQIADYLDVNPGTAARALQLLRDRGLLVLQRKPGPSGQFGLSVYLLNPVDGLTVKRPDTNPSRTPDPSGVQPHVKDPHTVTASAGPPPVENRTW